MKEQTRQTVRQIVCVVAYLLALCCSVVGIVYSLRWGFFGDELTGALSGERNFVYLQLAAFLALALGAAWRLIPLLLCLVRQTPVVRAETERWAKIAYATCASVFLLGVILWITQWEFGVTISRLFCCLSALALSVAFLAAEWRRSPLCVPSEVGKWLFPVAIGVGAVSLGAAIFTGYEVFANTHKVQDVPFLYQTSVPYYVGYLVAVVVFVAALTAICACRKPQRENSNA